MIQQDVTGQFDARDIQENKAMAILAYLSFLVVVPIVAARNSRYAMFHANYGVILAAVEIVSGVVLRLFGWIPVAGFAVRLVVGIIGLVALVLMVLGIVNVLGGRARRLPLIGGITILR